MLQSLVLFSESATAAFAEMVGGGVSNGDVLLLEGPIGAGKTHFARALIQSQLADCGLAEDVPSPTYTLVQTYHAGELEIWHADLYRLSHMGEIAELGLDAAFETAVCLIEWPDRLGGQVPQNAAKLSLAFDAANQNIRHLTISCPDHGWQALQQAVADFAKQEKRA